MKDAIELIREERERQKNVEGWTPEHDDEHTNGELANAASCYAMTEDERETVLSIYFCAQGRDFDNREDKPLSWPWAKMWWKPTSNDRIKELVKAGALIVAEIERLQRMEK